MRWLRFLRRTPCALLLLVQMLGVLLYPFMEDWVAAQSLLALFGLVVLGLTILAVRATPFLSWVAVLLAGPAVVLLLVQMVTGSNELVPYAAVFEGLLYFYAAGAMMRYMLADDHVTTDELFAVGAVFTLLAWGWAYTYLVVQALSPGSFTAAVNPTADRGWTELLFLSFTTLSSTGLSDIVPVKGHARSVVMIEQVAGLFYIALVVSRMVGLKVARVKRAQDE